MARLFGTDGVRGIAKAHLNAELAYKLGRAAAQYFGREVKSPKIIIGRDTRLSGTMLESALAAGICSAGGNAHLLGVIPTPAVSYLTEKLGASAGVVISASHNPFEDNGIKFFAKTGFKLPDAVEDEIEAIVNQPIDYTKTLTGSSVGRVIQEPDMAMEYIQHIVACADTKLNGLKVVMDCANGANSQVAPAILRLLGAQVIPIYDQPNGININNGCGSTHLESLKETVLKYGADVGIANDGDADRCLAVDEKGQEMDGDQIMLLCAMKLKAEGRLKQDTVVGTVMSNIGFHKALKEMGCKTEITAVGDRYVLEKMRKDGYSLGGEQSGHIIFLDYNTTGDGLLTAVQLLSIMKQQNKPLSELAGLMTRYPQILKNVRVQTKSGWEDNNLIMAAISAGEEELGDEGRILVRPSGTEPLIRVMAEGPDLDQLERIVDDIAVVVEHEMGPSK